MKFTLNLPKLILLLTLSFSFIACEVSDNDGNAPVESLNIVETAANESDLSNLVAALGAAEGDLLGVLSGGQYTVLAPNNFAFDIFLADNGFASLDEVPADLLQTILLNHVITGTVSSSDLAAAGNGYATTNATNMDGDNLSMYFTTENGVVFNGGSSVIAADVTASNGVIHIVDAVIGLPTVAAFVTTNSAFETLLAAGASADLTEDFISILSTTTDPAPFTVFAPTNDAFGSLLTELGIESLNDIEPETLEATLGTHVVVGANVRSTDLTIGMTITTVSDNNLTFSMDAGPQLMDVNGRFANIIGFDIQAYNGVIHVIDKVLLP